jgi:hypothetical protein
MNEGPEIELLADELGAVVEPNGLRVSYSQTCGSCVRARCCGGKAPVHQRSSGTEAAGISSIRTIVMQVHRRGISREPCAIGGSFAATPILFSKTDRTFAIRKFQLRRL